MFNFTELVRLTWIWHPGMSIQKLGFQSTLQLLEFIKAVFTELVVSALCNAVCMILHQTLAPHISQASEFLHLLFPKCLNSETANTSFLIYRGAKGALIKDC